MRTPAADRVLTAVDVVLQKEKALCEWMMKGAAQYIVCAENAKAMFHNLRRQVGKLEKTWLRTNKLGSLQKRSAHTVVSAEEK